ncbi:hypothetical protein AX766_07065 [Flavobacterium covae]|nr:hypothetical protein AX766_07020 [Flavobacterium covae]AND64189.1 hypothetical protein AX766_07065 [Flavobacterium covae]
MHFFKWKPSERQSSKKIEHHITKEPVKGRENTQRPVNICLLPLINKNLFLYLKQNNKHVLLK